jgi:hypothetical protein
MIIDDFDFIRLVTRRGLRGADDETEEGAKGLYSSL